MYHSALSARMGLGMTEEKALDLLQRLGPLSAGDLARHSGLAPASVSGLIDRLQAKGFVRRVRDEGDRRRVIVEIDPSRVQAFAELFAGFVRGLDEMYAAYGDDELALILDFLRRVTAVQREATIRLTGQDGAGG
ncbi:MarR family transcriptional regulator [Actinomadura sp. NAK00032]|nr:MarR family transcriptional regulator [Actinomadura sp. NAK00032]